VGKTATVTLPPSLSIPHYDKGGKEGGKEGRKEDVKDRKK
jgi:hypothetical protein